MNDAPSKFRALPDGEYTFTVKNYKIETASTGTKYVKVTLSVEDENGEVYVSDKLYLSKGASWKLSAFFSSINMWNDVREKKFSMSFFDMAIGKEGRFELTHHVYNGKTYNDVESYRKILPAAVR